MATRAQIEELLAEYEPRVRDAFLRAVADVVDSVVLTQVAAALRRGDLESAVAAVDLDPTVFASVVDQTEDLYRAAGVLTTDTLPPLVRADGARTVLRFNVRQPRAENWLRQHSSQLVTRLSDEAQRSVRSALSYGMQRGLNPNTTALDLVGRISAQTGRRVGGTIGLTEQQLEYVQSAREELRSGDPARIANYLRRQRRDRRFDRTVIRAMESGRPLSADQVAKIVARYTDSHLQLRGETIARTESLTALHEGQYEAMRQQIESGKLKAEWVVKKWHSSALSNVRHTHRALNGQEVPFDQPFRSPSGARLMYPCDRSLGAGADEIANCRCRAEYKVDYLARVVENARRRQTA